MTCVACKHGPEVSVMLTIATDLGFALLRVHLSGYHVISLLLLRLGSRAWSDLDCGPSFVRPVHIDHRLVCATLKAPRQLPTDTS